MKENTVTNEKENNMTPPCVEEIAAQLGLTAEAAVAHMKQALNMEEEVKNAETQGYLRSRNEQIELMTHPRDDDEPEHAPATFPRYHRRSIWEF